MPVEAKQRSQSLHDRATLSCTLRLGFDGDVGGGDDDDSADRGDSDDGMTITMAEEKDPDDDRGPLPPLRRWRETLAERGIDSLGA